MDEKKDESVEEEIEKEGKEGTEAPAPEETDELAKTKAEAEDFKRKWYAVTAEYENYRKRTQFSRTQAYADGRSDVIAKLFPIADNLERAIKICTDESTAKGLEMVMKSFCKLLEDEKVVVIDPVGAPFDPETSEAIMAVEDGSMESGTVKEVYQKGYMREGKVLRFAQVVVVK